MLLRKHIFKLFSTTMGARNVCLKRKKEWKEKKKEKAEILPQSLDSGNWGFKKDTTYCETSTKIVRVGNTELSIGSNIKKTGRVAKESVLIFLLYFLHVPLWTSSKRIGFFFSNI